ncbi:hypothetical protein PZN02_004456 [Sinorhizobium garamanticum]|uniref:PIN domain-containing protein n=1 Tax=Sinorhizobium garamanticum TaxID=680247 RepID=A0ABY8DJ01_9HYPH|nr:hypothetical protein [Sinorhizobium garamanticum]WEX90879.1 hypothetical protein PZN02_004456 [Sinorhizobium garamanticum]
MRYLLDTNVVSELRRIGDGKADTNVAWVGAEDARRFLASAITILELERSVLGVQRRERFFRANGFKSSGAASCGFNWGKNVGGIFSARTAHVTGCRRGIVVARGEALKRQGFSTNRLTCSVRP